MDIFTAQSSIGRIQDLRADLLSKAMPVKVIVTDTIEFKYSPAVTKMLKDLDDLYKEAVRVINGHNL